MESMALSHAEMPLEGGTFRIEVQRDERTIGILQTPRLARVRRDRLRPARYQQDLHDQALAPVGKPVDGSRSVDNHLPWKINSPDPPAGRNAHAAKGRERNHVPRWTGYADGNRVPALLDPGAPVRGTAASRLRPAPRAGAGRGFRRLPRHRRQGRAARRVLLPSQRIV